jgi:hypothetical protein
MKHKTSFNSEVQIWGVCCFQMKYPIPLKALVGVALLLSSSASLACGVITGLFTRQGVPLSYVGNVSFQKPITEGDLTRIPMTFTGGKWHENSGRVLKGVKSKRHGYEVHFTVETCLASGTDKQIRPEIELKGLQPGKYQLIYQNPDKTSIRLGEIEI